MGRRARDVRARRWGREPSWRGESYRRAGEPGAAPEADGVEGGVEPGRSDRGLHLREGPAGEHVRLDEVLDPGGGADQVVEVHVREPALLADHVHARELEGGFV